ncbi:hypothetical protein [Spiroplasma sp. AdecLV25b]|uniref:hypothetical protein n=1 Tax=Spiroplasma sp. AdecLV25b TaxID=3027162 RepID=UPI0027E045E3|nr:hypothetical protein [Spiroplasma sp. AdecLV25b]
MFLTKAFFHGESIKTLFFSPNQRIENVQVLNNQHASYILLEFIYNHSLLRLIEPHAPDSITVVASFLEEIKDGIILLIIISPVFVGIFHLQLLSLN